MPGGDVRVWGGGEVPGSEVPGGEVRVGVRCGWR